jgi:hypothetical protein
MLYTAGDLASLAEKILSTNPDDAADAAGADPNQVQALALTFNGTDAVNVVMEELPDADVSDPTIDPAWTATAWQDTNGMIHVRGAIPAWLVVK